MLPNFYMFFTVCCMCEKLCLPMFVLFWLRYLRESHLHFFSLHQPPPQSALGLICIKIIITFFPLFIFMFFLLFGPKNPRKHTHTLTIKQKFIKNSTQSNVRPESRLFSFLTPLAWSIWISMVRRAPASGDNSKRLAFLPHSTEILLIISLFFLSFLI